MVLMCRERGDSGQRSRRLGWTTSNEWLRPNAQHLVAVLCVLLSFFPPTLNSQPQNLADPSQDGYAIIVDAGSSGCRVHVFKLQWDKTGTSRIPHVQLPDHKKKVKPGLSSFKDNPSAAGRSLEDIMKFAMDNIPQEYHSKTPIRLAATAGLRMIPTEAAEQILDSCYQYISSHTPFIVKREKVSVISGLDEGAFGWLSVNFLYKRLKGMANESTLPPEATLIRVNALQHGPDAVSAGFLAKIYLGTVGTIEMGGASTQVTAQLPQAPADASKSWLYSLSLGGAEYALYTHSYLGFGQDAARERYNQVLPGSADPCFPKNYSKTLASPNPYDGKDGVVQGLGNYSACRHLIAASLFPHSPCEAPPCSFGGTHQPPIWPAAPAHGGFVMFENFFHSSKAVGLAGMESGLGLADFDRAGEEYCGRRWQEIESRSQTGLYPALNSGEETKYCFSLAFFSAFLGKGLGVPLSAKFPVIGSVDGVDIDWSLGMMLAEVLPAQGAAPPPPPAPPVPAASLPPAPASPHAPSPSAPLSPSAPAPPAIAPPAIAPPAIAPPAIAPPAIAPSAAPPAPAPAPPPPLLPPPAAASLPPVALPASHAASDPRPPAPAPAAAAAPPKIVLSGDEVAVNKPLAGAGGFAIPSANVSKGVPGGGAPIGDKFAGSKIGLVVHTPAPAPAEPKEEWGDGAPKDLAGAGGALPKAKLVPPKSVPANSVPANALPAAVEQLAPSGGGEAKKAMDRQQQLQSEFKGPPRPATTAPAPAPAVREEFRVGGSERSFLGRALGLVGGASVLALVAALAVMFFRRSSASPSTRPPRSLSGTRLDLEEGRRMERYRDKDH